MLDILDTLSGFNLLLRTIINEYTIT